MPTTVTKVAAYIREYYREFHRFPALSSVEVATECSHGTAWTAIKIVKREVST